VCWSSARSSRGSREPITGKNKKQGVGSGPAEGQTVVVSRKCPAEAGNVRRVFLGGTAGRTHPYTRRSVDTISPRVAIN